ncbi:alpha-amylase family glycosyl hydrolase [Halarcobacter anaerophilus]|uniref:Sugar phosphorylase n=1 Tax=Halarcobacter anaerophilus TaxID=877500 RepID=A0A4Q0XZN1_9BACT|nr:alpha-amylase family glycosyl hydrolase [Halarcobacter anaerophilus]QDF29810.1 sucrose phosphorylase [Halarcobacter anaerophilus]RXJ62773.1 sugar phosphorylase [Halarcobacter anaerophilus]
MKHKHISDPEHTINKRINRIYPPEVAEKAVNSIIDLIFKYKQRIISKEYHLSQKDIILITYGDQVNRDHEATLQTLKEFIDHHLKGVINSVHILPFYPSSSDDGFSVVSYNAVDPKMGSWRQIESISGDYRLMVDGVINHVSQFSDWFKAYLAGDKYFQDYFIEVDPSLDLSMVARPRATPLLSEFTDDEGKIRHIWTTFSKDQVDLNYKSHRVLRNVLDCLFYYIEKGATLIRLDAIAFIWKEIGTRCVHLPQTHELIQLMREVLHEVAPEVIIITETNVPHHENVSYFGSGDDEAQMVYNFALPPLLVHSILHQNTKTLTSWAKTLTLPSDKVCFFNFTASHDGIGLRPVNDILSKEEIDFLVEKVQSHGGLVSYRAEPDGTQSPYELNCSYIDALTHPEEEDQLRFKRMLLAQATVLVMPGVPGIYFHSLVGSRNYHEGVKHSGVNRAINREKYNMDWLEEELAKQGALPKRMLDSYKRLISIRINEKAFDPFGKFEFLDLDEKLFAIDQRCKDNIERVLAIHNFSDEEVKCKIPENIGGTLCDILTSNCIISESDSETQKNNNEITLEPYQMMWLKGRV